MNCHNLIGREKGYTLVEIMIAMLLGLFLTNGIIQVFIGSKQSYRMQENMSRLQENGRFAMFFLARDLRMSGYWGCVKNNDNVITNNLDSSGTGYDTNIHVFSNNINGTNGTEDGSNSALDLSDSIAVRGAFDSGVRITASSSSVPTLSTASGLSAGDIAIVSDCRAGDIFQVDTAANEDPGNSSATVSKTYATDSRVFQLQTKTYTIQTDGNGLTGLFRQVNGGTAEMLIEGIVNMQILYGVDDDGNKTPDYYVAASGGLDYANVISVRISLLAQTVEDNLTQQSVLYAYNGSTTTPGDRRKRQVFSSTIAIRNQLP